MPGLNTETLSSQANMGCSRNFKYRRLFQLLVGSCRVKDRAVQSGQRNTKLSIQVHSLTEIHQPSTPLHSYMYVKLIRNNASSSKLAAGRACGPSKFASRCSNYMIVARSLTQRCATGAGSSPWAGSVLKTKEGVIWPRVQYSASNSDCVRGDATCPSARHCRGHARSCNDGILHFDRIPAREIPSRVMGAALALTRSKS
jgi:hypothetical protein